LPFVEFSYNRTVHSTTGFSPFEIVYGFNPLTPMDLIPLPFEEKVSLDGEKKAKMVRQLYEGVRLQIEKKNRLYASKANKGRKLVVFQPGDWVWVHMCKERFPNQRKSKLQPCSDSPFQVLERINDNAYKLTFQVSMVLVLPLMLLILCCLTQILIRGRILSMREGMMWTSIETPARTHYMFQMVQ
jgi:hypothetical protein